MNEKFQKINNHDNVACLFFLGFEFLHLNLNIFGVFLYRQNDTFKHEKNDKNELVLIDIFVSNEELVF